MDYRVRWLGGRAVCPAQEGLKKGEHPHLAAMHSLSTPPAEGFAADRGGRFRLLAVGVMACLLSVGCRHSGRDSDPTAGEQRIFNLGNGTELEFRWIPAGEFVMGSPPDEPGRGYDENQTLVKMPKGFWIAATETTAATWQSVMGTPAGKPPSTSQKPVVRVSWYDCQEFLKKLKAPAKGWKFQLPSEAEWEYACRAGSRTAFPRRPTDVGWLDMNSGGFRHPVGTKAPNAWSVRDMHGNVAEWCRDAVGQGGTEYAIRGGSWDSDLSARAAARNSDTPFLRINRVGFRLVLVREKSPDSTHLPPVCKITTSHTP